MKHVKKAHIAMKDAGNPNIGNIHYDLINDGHGEIESVTFNIQSGTIKDVGINGCQARDIIEYALHLIESFNASFPCPENVCTIAHLEEALKWQDARTKDREKRGVEGKNLV